MLHIRQYYIVHLFLVYIQYSSSASHPVDGDGWEGVWLWTVGGHIAGVVAGVPIVPRVGVARPWAGRAGAREHSEIVVMVVVVIIKFVLNISPVTVCVWTIVPSAVAPQSRQHRAGLLQSHGCRNGNIVTNCLLFTGSLARNIPLASNYLHLHPPRGW